MPSTQRLFAPATQQLLLPVLFLLSVCIIFSADLRAETTLSILQSERISPTASRVSLNFPSARIPSLRSVAAVHESIEATIELPDGTTGHYALHNETVLSSQLRAVEVVAGQTREIVMPQQAFLVGDDPAVSGSYVYLALDETGRANGFIDNPTGTDWSLSSSTDKSQLYLTALGGDDDLPDGIPVCGLTADGVPRKSVKSLASILSPNGPRLARVAIDVDSVMAAAFPTSGDAASYVAQIIGAVTAVYLRDIDVRLVLSQVRVFTGATPFSADDLGGFGTYWENNEDTSLYDIVHMFSMRRDLPYGGVAYLSGTCSGAYGIDGFLNGSFPAPTPLYGRGLWDVIVVAHEMGHNLGTLHTHDGYDPPIDQCGSIGQVSVGTIMSYCHTVHGGEYNLDLRMHRLVEDVIASQVAGEGCLSFDCNGNSIPDTLDIQLGTSLDVNGDGIPDECQDCNGNGILDPVDIAEGAPDINFNGIPDICEPDCNGNQIPDRFEIANDMTPDLDGNDRPDACDAHCDNGVNPDHEMLGGSLTNDVNRNRIPDDCSADDCNGNGNPDWLDMQEQNCLFACYPGTTSGLIAYHDYSGVRALDVARSMNGTLQALTITSSHRLILLHSGGQITRLTTGGSESILISVPKATDIRAFDTKLVIADSSNGGQLLLVDVANGGILHTEPVMVSGSPNVPVAITRSPSGTLYVVTRQRNLLEYSVSAWTISLLGVRVPAVQAGPMSNPNALVVVSPTQILISSSGTNQILQYNGVSGTFTGDFLKIGTVNSVTDLEMGPNGKVMVAFSNTSNINQYEPALGRSMARYMRGLDGQITASTVDMEFMPASDFDCNQNGRLDACDIALGSSLDVNHDGLPDECVPPPPCCVGTTGDVACDGGVDIADLTALVDFLFVSFTPLCCESAANVDGIGGVDIGDLTLLVDNLFISFTPLSPCAP